MNRAPVNHIDQILTPRSTLIYTDGRQLARPNISAIGT